VGLNSKVGTANFVRGLASRLGQELRPAAPTLLKPLVSGVARESSAPVKRAYAAAAASLAARCCSDKRRDKFVADAVASYGAAEVQLQPWRAGDAAAAAPAAPMAVDEPSGGGDDASRQAGGLLLRELLKESSDTFNSYASQVSGDWSRHVMFDAEKLGVVFVVGSVFHVAGQRLCYILTGLSH
jgi:hypothetical protein